MRRPHSACLVLVFRVIQPQEHNEKEQSYAPYRLCISPPQDFIHRGVEVDVKRMPHFLTAFTMMTDCPI